MSKESKTMELPEVLQRLKVKLGESDEYQAVEQEYRRLKQAGFDRIASNYLVKLTAEYKLGVEIG
jgi:hypothetical protein